MQGRVIVILVALATALVTVPGSALATHNSIGAHVHVVEADEVNAGTDIPSEERGELTPDLEPGGPYDLDFHRNLEAGDPPLEARSAPDDQTGLRYHGESCTSWGEVKEDFGGATPEAVDAYDAALTGEDANGCYIGFLDQQLEYLLVTTLLLIEQDDALYPVNPKADDGHCRGQEDTSDRGVGPVGLPGSNESVGADVPIVVGEGSAVDQTITRAFRANTDECDGSGEDTALFCCSVNIDQDLLDAGFTTAHNATQSDPGSGTWSLPVTGSTYTYLFGQPHPTTEEKGKTSGFEAGEGPFGSNPANFGSPIADISGACGDRTKDCELLTPDDVLRYDDNFPSDSTRARVCYFIPQYKFSPAGGSGTTNRGASACGNWGERADSYVGTLTAGGFGTGAAPSWAHTLPGWYWGVLYIPTEMYDGMVDVMSEEDEHTERPPGWRNVVFTARRDGVAMDRTPDGFAQDYFDEEQHMRKGFTSYVAVNPVVPKGQSALRCVTPNVLAEGDDSKLPDSFDGEDPGVYGTYQADAIDADVYPTTFRQQFATARDATHDPVRDGVGPVPGLAAAQDATGLTYPQPWIDETAADAGQATETVGLPDQIEYRESSDPEPHAEYHASDYQDTNPTSKNAAPFLDVSEKGLQCNPAGDLVFRDSQIERGGGMQFDVNLQHQAASGTANLKLKDPTLGVVSEEESDAGAWQPDLYSFGGAAHAALDTNGNQQFDSCPGANLDPSEDVCPWEALWDSYNSNCDDNDQTLCGTLLDERGYNTSRGVGLVFNLTVTGPMVLFTETTTEQNQYAERTVIGNTEEPTGRTCVIGTSTGFAPDLAKLVGTKTDDDTSFDEEDARAFCPDETVDDDNWALVEDAFNDQSASNPGGFSAAVQWAKLLPTPAAVQDSTGFGAEDKLCTTGVWNVEDRNPDGGINNTATGDGNGIADDTEADPDSPGQENIVLRFDETTPADLSTTPFDDSLNGLHTFSDCDFFDTTGEPEQ